MAGENSLAITVAVVHADELMRVGIHTVVEHETDLQVVHACERLDALTAAATAGGLAAPQVVVAQLAAPLDLGVAALLRWRRACPQAPLVVIGELTPLLVQRAVEAGVMGVLPLNVARTELVQCLRTVAGGGLHANSWLQERLRAGHQRLRSAGADAGVQLSARELEVLRLMAHPAGYTYRAIAEQLGIGEATVRTHRDNLFAKFGVNNRQALVAAAAKRGLV